MFLVFQIKEIMNLKKKKIIKNGHSLLLSRFILQPSKGITCLLKQAPQNLKMF